MLNKFLGFIIIVILVGLALLTIISTHVIAYKCYVGEIYPLFILFGLMSIVVDLAVILGLIER